MTRIGTIAMVAPANMIFHAAAPSPAFFNMVTPTVRGRFEASVIVNTSGRIYSFQPPRKDNSATVARIGFNTGRMIL